MEMAKKPDIVPPIAWLSCIAGIAGAVCTLVAFLTVTLFSAASFAAVLLPCTLIGVAVLAAAALILGALGLSRSSRRETFSRKGRSCRKSA